MPTMDGDTLWRRASERWADISANSPDLAPAVALQRRLLRLILDTSAQLREPLATTLTDEAVLDKWRRGLPAWRNERVAIPDALTDAVPAFCQAIAEAGAGDSALHIRDALLNGQMDAGSLLRVSLARNQKAIRTSALHMGFSPDLVWLVGELGSSSLAHHLQQQLLGSAPQAGTGGSAQDLRDWDRGYCPFCGSWPVLIELRATTATLRCSYCALAWALQSHRCVYCGNAGEDFVAAAPDVGRRQRRVDLCGRCGAYTKVVGVMDETPFPLLAIEDLASLDLDRGAMSRDYRRPELHDLDGIEPLSQPR